MAKKLFLFSLFCFFCLIFQNSSAEEKAASPEPKAEKAGYALLDKYIMTFKRMAETGTGGKEVLDKALEEMMAEAKKAKSAGSLDPVFYRRYNRLLAISKLFIIEDRQGILGPLITQEVGKFAEDVKGIELDPNIYPLGPVADALAEEVIDLHLYLENAPKKEIKSSSWL